MESTILITDLGTTFCKSILFDSNLKKISKDSKECQTIRTRPQWAEQNPLEWWEAFKSTVKSSLSKGNIKPEQISTIGILGMGHGLVLLDSRDQVLLPCILWPDLRAIQQAEYFQKKVFELGLERSISNNGFAWGTPAKLLWIRENFPDKYDMISKVLLPKDYLRYRLTGVLATDFGDAIASQIFDMRKREWSKDVLDIVGLNPNVFPPVMRMDEFAGMVSQESSKETGLSSDTKVIVGAGDWETFLYGLGSIELGEGYIYLGSAPTFGILLDKEFHDEVLRTRGFFLERYGNSRDRWLLSGSMGVAGAALTWFNELFGARNNDEGARELTKAASAVEPGAEGLFLLPHMVGERCPIDPQARGVLIGLSLGHSKKHIARASIEGITFALRLCVEIAEKGAGFKARHFKVFGGGSTIPLMVEILANVLSRPVLVTEEDELGALGLASIVLQRNDGREVISDYGDPTPIARIIEPTAELASKYERLFQTYTEIEKGMSNVYRSFSGLS